jgi:hypothetical protein
MMNTVPGKVSAVSDEGIWFSKNADNTWVRVTLFHMDFTVPAVHAL